MARIYLRPWDQPPENGRTISTSSSGPRAVDDHSERRTTEPLTATARNRAAGSMPRDANSSLTVFAATSSFTPLTLSCIIGLPRQRRGGTAASVGERYH